MISSAPSEIFLSCDHLRIFQQARPNHGYMGRFCWRSWLSFVLEGGTFWEVSWMHVIPFHCVFISNGGLFVDDVKKIKSGLIIMGIYERWGRLLRWGLGVVQAVIYHCNAVPVRGVEKSQNLTQQQHACIEGLNIYALCFVLWRFFFPEETGCLENWSCFISSVSALIF